MGERIARMILRLGNPSRLRAICDVSWSVPSLLQSGPFHGYHLRYCEAPPCYERRNGAGPKSPARADVPALRLPTSATSGVAASS